MKHCNLITKKLTQKTVGRGKFLCGVAHIEGYTLIFFFILDWPDPPSQKYPAHISSPPQRLHTHKTISFPVYLIKPFSPLFLEIKA